jgi:hypothetical protein
VAQDFEQGDRVRWKTPQGETYGKVAREAEVELGSAGSTAISWVSVAPKPKLIL